MKHENWLGFNEGSWQDEINVRNFIQVNYKEYKGDDSFLSGATKRTDELMAKVQELFKKERKNGGVLDVDTEKVSSLLSYLPGYIDKDNEIIVGMQRHAFGVNVLVKNKNLLLENGFEGMDEEETQPVIDKVSIEDILLYIVKSRETMKNTTEVKEA